MNHPLWATREFRWLVGIGVLAVSGLLVLVFEVMPLARQKPPVETQPLEKIEAAELEAAKDATPVGESGPGYRLLVDLVNQLGPDALQASTQRLPYSSFYQDTPGTRGTIVTVTGLLGDFKPIALDEKIGSIDVVHRAYIIEPSGTEGYIVDLIEAPQWREERLLVTVKGIFLRLATYEGKYGTVTAPLLIARKLELTPRRYEPTNLSAKAGLVAMVILGGALLLLTFFISRAAHARRLPQIRRQHWTGRARPEPWKASLGLESSAFHAQPAWQAPAAPRWKWIPSPPRARLRGAGKARGTRREDLSDLSRRQQRLVILATCASGVVLLGLAAYSVYLRLRPSHTTIGFTEAVSTLYAGASTARSEITPLEERLAMEGAKPQPEDHEVLRHGLDKLQDSAEKLQAAFDKVGKAKLELAPADLRAASAKILQVKCWVLDAEDLLAGLNSGTTMSGYQVPFRTTARRWRERVAAFESGSAPGAQAPPSATGKPAPETVAAVRSPDARARAEELARSLEESKAELAKLEEYLKAGLAREDLTAEELPELAELQKESALVEQQIAKATKLARETQP